MKKTMQKALRPLSSKRLNPPPDIRTRIIERMQRLVEEALNGRKLNEQYLFILEYLSVVVDFHNTADQKTKDAFFRQIMKNENKGHRLGFDKEELSSLNFLVLKARVDGQLAAFAKRIKEKESQ